MTRGYTSLFRLRRKQFTSSLLSLLATCILLLVTLKYSFLVEPPGAGLDVHEFRTYNIDCAAIYDQDPVEVGRSLIIRKAVAAEEEDDDEGLTNLTSNCPRYIRSRGYGAMRVSQEEWDFPIAYSLVVHKSAWEVERLIHALYSPSNVYCIHYDRKSPARFVDAMEGLARCLPNVFIASERESVIYASISRLRADLHCLSDLLESEVRWRYVINLCGLDFPLLSNAELVVELRRLNGSNMLETSRPSAYKRKRFSFRYKLQEASFEYRQLPVRTKHKKDPPPHGIEMFIGNAYFVLSQEFVAYANSAPLVQDFLAWSEDTYSPDEHFWATLVRVPGAPGEVARSRPDITDLMSKTRLVKWSYLEGTLYPLCSGKHIRAVCIYGVAELRWLLNYGHWFANKVDPKVDPVLIQCLEEKLQDKQKLIQSRTARLRG